MKKIINKQIKIKFNEDKQVTVLFLNLFLPKETFFQSRTEH